MRKEKVACGLNRKAGMSEIRRLYHRFEKDSFKDDRKIIKAWLLELATSALRGEMDDWKYVDTYGEGLEELLKRALPELDRLSKAEKTKADFGSVDRVVAEVTRLADAVSHGEEQRRDLSTTLDTKFDSALGRQALDALARQQQQVA